MSFMPGLIADITYMPTAAPRWEMSLSANRIDEGDPVTISFRVRNGFTGARIRMQWLGGLAAAGSWTENWVTLLEQACAAVGITVQAEAVGGIQINRILTIGPAYTGQTVSITNTAVKNRRTDAGNTPDDGVPGAPGYRQMQMQWQNVPNHAPVPTSAITNPSSADPDYPVGSARRTIFGNAIRVRDTSKTPAGTPIISMLAFAADGVTPAQQEYERNSALQIAFITSDMLPGTKVRASIVNVGQSEFSPSWRAAFRAAIVAAGCRYESPTLEGYYNGETIIYTGDYSDANPIRVPMQIKPGQQEGRLQVDWLMSIIRDADLDEYATVAAKGIWSASATYRNGDTVIWQNDGGNYVYSAASASSGHSPADAGYWTAYRKTQSFGGVVTRFIKEAPPRYWELRATTDGSTITYRLQIPLNSSASTVRLVSGGNVPGGFGVALQGVFAANPDIASFDVSTGIITALTADPARVSLQFTVPHPAGQPGKHTLRFVDETGPAYVVIADACVFLTAPTLPDDPDFIVGVNLSGGEFGRKESSGFDVYNTNYRYQSRPQNADPATRHQVMDYHWSKGVRIARIPCLWGRIQDSLFGPLSGTTGLPFTADNRLDMLRLDEMIAYWTGLGGIAIFDVHNFGGGPSLPDGVSGGKIGYDQQVTTAAFVDLWVKLANRYAGNQKVWFGLMNEPHGGAQSPKRVRDYSHSAINAIRARTPALNKILVCGASYSSASGWVTNGTAEAFEEFYDPADNFAFEPHNYFDADTSGQSGVCVAGTEARLYSITGWARSRGFRLFMGELAGGDPTLSGQEACAGVLSAAYGYMSSNRDVWLGWTTWGAGDFWGASYIFRLDPASYTSPVDRETMRMLLPFLAA